ncbi:12446_t:CDS:1 [Funneliformis geosporum]|uniref:12446_t:CDS:1 n=1 Tax=Funneliformis geosporum TaxID=1117311 RepID=A0A9W4SAX4_9GLOM|nr:12446_t:CDS:1 [Funneliformis geosporum]
MDTLITITKKSKRVGRGIGSGRGKTAGRGQKGQGARKSPHTRPGFEGGQVPIFLRFPKRGFKGRKKLGQVINLEKLEQDKEIVSGQVIDFRKSKSPTKILGRGELTKILTIKAAAFSQQAQQKITKLGGKIEITTK